jgi:hypothetical protein
LIALVLDLGAVIDHCSTATAVHAASPELGVEGVQGLTTDSVDLQLSEQRHDVVPDETLVALTRRGLDASDLQVALHQLSDGRRRPRLAARVDLGEQARPDLLSLRRGARAGGHRLGEVVPLAGDGVDAGVHADPQRPAGQLEDLTPLPPTGPGFVAMEPN